MRSSTVCVGVDVAMSQRCRPASGSLVARGTCLSHRLIRKRKKRKKKREGKGREGGGGGGGERKKEMG